MRRLLEVIKNYARSAKESGYSSDLECSVTINLIEQKLNDSIVRNFRRWLYREHKTKRPNVDLLITFLTNETELEERLNQSHSNNTSSKSKFVKLVKFIRRIFIILVLSMKKIAINLSNSRRLSTTPRNKERTR